MIQFDSSFVVSHDQTTAVLEGTLCLKAAPTDGYGACCGCDIRPCQILLDGRSHECCPDSRTDGRYVVWKKVR